MFYVRAILYTKFGEEVGGGGQGMHAHWMNVGWMVQKQRLMMMISPNRQRQRFSYPAFHLRAFSQLEGLLYCNGLHRYTIVFGF